MDWREYKIETTILGFLLLTVFSLFIAFQKGTQKQRGFINSEIQYEMARPSLSYSSDFDLSNREVLRNYIAQIKKETSEKGTLTYERKNLVGAQQGVLPQGKLEGAKTLPPQSNIKSKKPVAKKVKPKFEMNIVGSDSGYTLTSNESSEPNTIQAGIPLKVVKNTPQDLDSPPKEDDEDLRDWKKLMWNANSKLLQEFILSHKSGKISDEVFYEVIKDLITSTKQQFQLFGLQALRTNLTSRGFSESVKLSQLPEVEKTKGLKEALLNYQKQFLQPRLIGQVAVLLRNPKKEIALSAGLLLLDGIEKIKSGEIKSQNQGRDTRNQENTLTLKHFKDYVSLFRSIQQSPDSDLAKLGQAGIEALSPTVVQL